MCSIHEADAIYGMYKQFCEELQEGTFAREFCDSIVASLDHEGGAERLRGLTVELPLEEIRRIFDEHRVILLRDASASRSLLVGCGNSPITDIICKGEGHNHEHAGIVTIDPDITKNPTVIGAFGSQESLHAFLPKKHYTSLISELSSVAQTVDDISKRTLDCMADDFKCYAMNSAGELIEEKSFRESKLFNQNSCLF